MKRGMRVSIRSLIKIVSYKMTQSSFGYGKGTCDDWFTPSSALLQIEPFIPPGSIIWECFMPTELPDSIVESASTLRSMGYTVVTTRGDFFKNDGYGTDIVVSNPPYHTPSKQRNIKERVIERLCELGKPFMLLLPTYYLQTLSFKKLQNKYGRFGVVMPSKKINFYKVHAESKTKAAKAKGCSFYTVWLCHKVILPKSFMVV